MLKVSFHYADRPLFLQAKKKIRSFIESGIFTNEKAALSRLTYIFCSDEYLAAINKEYLKHDYYTDIITFDLSDYKELVGVTGEVYISTDRVRENAKTLGIPFKEEILRVIIHGALHLCGYKDKTALEIKLMREKENSYIERFKKSST